MTSGENKRFRTETMSVLPFQQEKMMRRMIALFLLTAVLAASAAHGFAGEKKVTLSGHPSPHTIPTYAALQKGWFKEEGLDIDLLIYISGPPQMEAVPSNTWQLGTAGTPATISGVLGYENVMLGFGVWDHPANMLFVRPDSPIAKKGTGHIPGYPEIYGEPEDYKGLRILCPRGTLAHIQLLATLKAIGLKEDDVDIIHMEIPSAYQAFRAGEGDAVCLWSTFTLQGFQNGWIEASGCTKARFPVPSIIQAVARFEKNDPETVQKIMNVLVRAMMWVNANKEEASAIYYEVCQEEGVSATEEFCRTTMDMHDAPSIEQMEEMLENDGFRKVLRDIMDFYIASGTYNEKETEEFLAGWNDSYLRKAVENYKKNHMNEQ